MSLHILPGYQDFPFGKESTAQELQKRITWEKAHVQYFSAFTTPTHAILAQAHHNSCMTYRSLLARKFGLTA